MILQAALAALSWTLGAPRVPPSPTIPIYPYCPDGHLSLVRGPKQVQMFWAGATSYGTAGADIWQQGAPRALVGPGGRGAFDNGGAWLMGVFPRTSTNWLGFVHAEDHEFRGDPASRGVAWKSIALAHSDDGERSWRKGEPILSSAAPKPDAPTWGGVGDFCVVRDEKRRRWVCFYQEHFLSMAASSDAGASAGTWKKWFGGTFCQPGLRGLSSPIPGLMSVPGGNPSVHWNTKLRRWVMVWHGWDSGAQPASLWISSSADLDHWAAPQLLLAAPQGEKLWYPTIFGNDDKSAGAQAWLCYARFPRKDASERQFVVRPIHLEAQHNAT